MFIGNLGRRDKKCGGIFRGMKERTFWVSRVMNYGSMTNPEQLADREIEATSKKAGQSRQRRQDEECV